MRNTVLTFIYLFSQIAVAATPVPYQWGVYKPSQFSKDKKIILVDWFSDEGKRRFGRSRYTNDFYQVAHAYQPQINPVYASVASAVIVLNALRLPKHNVPSQTELEIKTPKAMGGETLPFPAFSQLTFLNEKTDAIKDRKLITLKNVTPENEADAAKFKPGIGLEDLKRMLVEVYGAKAEVTYADKATKEGSDKFRNTLTEVLRDTNRFLIANFKGDTLGAATGGTMSPIVAYDPHSDSVLVLDVTGHKNPWYWAPLVAFYQSMNTQYDGNFRGYLTVSD